VALASSVGIPVSAAAIRVLSRSADGRRGAADSETAAAAPAPSCDDTVLAAPVTATPAMNLRRLTFGPFVLAKSLRGMSSSM